MFDFPQPGEIYRSAGFPDVAVVGILEDGIPWEMPYRCPDIVWNPYRRKFSILVRILADGRTTDIPLGRFLREFTCDRPDLFKRSPVTRLAVELTLLVFIRSSELRFARWSEVDFDTAMWTIPGEREPLEGVKHSQRGSKMRTPHLVPLSRQALTILEKIKSMSGNRELIFVGDHDPRKPMSENTLNKALRVMGYDTKTEVCGHGFRTMACSSLIESGLWSRDAVERQMSHQERSSVRAAYIHKAEHLGERMLMLQWWADYLDANRMAAITPFDYAKINSSFR